MKVFVAIPVHNADAYLSACLESLCAQTYRNWTCLLVDDASSDASSDICAAFVARDARFSLVRTSNRGAYGARNRALAQVPPDADAVYFADADDLFHPCLLEILVNALSSAPHIGWAAIDAVEFEGSSLPAFHMPHTLSSQMVDAFLSFSSHTLGLALWHFLIRTECLRGCSFAEDIRRGADRLFVYGLAQRLKTLVHVPALVYGYRQHTGSIVHTKLGPEQIMGYGEVMSRLADLYANDPCLRTLQRGEFVYLIKCIVKTCRKARDEASLRTCGQLITTLMRKKVILRRDFSWSWRLRFLLYHISVLALR